MERFFRESAEAESEEELIDFAASRYSDVNYVLSLPYECGMAVIKKGREKEEERRLFDQWVQFLPGMSMKYFDYVPFEAYRDNCTGANLDMRPVEVIMAEIEQLHKEVEHGRETV